MICFKKPEKHNDSLLLDSITRTSQTKRSRRSCLRAPGTDSSTCLPALRKTSGRSAFRPRRRASTEVTASCRVARGAMSHCHCNRHSGLSVLSRLHQGGLEPSAATAQKAAVQRVVLPQENIVRGAGKRPSSSVVTENRHLTVEWNDKSNSSF